MTCEMEQHIVELMEVLVGYEQDRLNALEEQALDLMAEVPHACQHIGLSGGDIAWSPVEFRPRRELDRACHDAIQDYYYFNLFDLRDQSDLLRDARDMLDRARGRLEDCKHRNKHD